MKGAVIGSANENSWIDLSSDPVFDNVMYYIVNLCPFVKRSFKSTT